LPDDWFEHDGQITKRDIRAITLSALQPFRGAHLWDIGAGSGSVAIEWVLLDPSNRATAIEAREDRAARIARNAVSFGVPDLRIVRGRAPDALAGCRSRMRFSSAGRQRPDHRRAASALPSGGRSSSTPSRWKPRRPDGPVS
jgi:precorrin-6Y C5,15-methyltransferase (decarboxylating) (EC 2.1.1.132)